jgi:uncharacterized RDD family membrane protein YckC
MTELLNGRLSLTTPEGVRLLLTPAGPAIRAFAWGLDFLVWLAAISITATVLSNSKLGEGIFGLLLFLSYWAYPVVCEVYFDGRTIGKRAAGIEVLRADGLPVGWRESALRNLLLAADFLPFCYTAGLLCMLFDPRFRRIGDVVARTQVVYRAKPPVRAAAPEAEPLPLPFPLSPDQQRALADLFTREKRLPADRMVELATIAEPLTGRTGEESLARLRGMAAGLLR